MLKNMERGLPKKPEILKGPEFKAAQSIYSEILTRHFGVSPKNAERTTQEIEKNIMHASTPAEAKYILNTFVNTVGHTITAIPNKKT
ncbi:MAG: hypothetical protein A3H17_03485 [Candidatus Levybacteria bacterium RIFCSPLOWO2_12_FULL_37_14]|nr:MAG: hypothetical protein A3H17_03485 [Candidatus Levybacteria bacterium RIFCSPLOWO2_12_FULL_37_14]